MLSLINAKSSQMTSIYCPNHYAYGVSKHLEGTICWVYMLSYLLACQIAASGKREVQRLWHLCFSNQIVRWFFWKDAIFGLWPTPCYKYVNPFGAASSLRLFPKLACNPWKSRSSLVGGIKEKYKTTGTDSPEGAKTSQENVRILIKHF